MAKIKTASRRKLGISARLGYVIGAALAGLWIIFYSLPKLVHIVANISENGGEALLLLAVAGICFGLLTEGKFAPLGMKVFRALSTPVDRVTWTAVLAYLVFYFPSPETLNWAFETVGIDGESKTLASILEAVGIELDRGAQGKRLSWVVAGWVGLIAFCIPSALAFLFRRLGEEVVVSLAIAMSLAMVIIAISLFGHPEHFIFAILAVVVPAILFVMLPGFMALREYVKELPLYRRIFVHGRGGSARFGSIYSFIKYDFSRSISGADSPSAPIYGGKTKFEDDPQLGCRHIGLNSDSMMITVAAMGGGKSLYSAWNTLLLWPGGALVLDPKGEHAQMTGKAREKFGDVHYLAPWSDEFPRATYNPIDDIDLRHPNARGELEQIVKACIPEGMGETANSKHFRENTQKIMLGIMAHVLSEFGSEYHNLPSIYDTILTGHPDGGAADPKAFDDLVTAMAVNEAFGRAPMDAAKVLSSAGENERGGFVTTLSNALNWVNDEVIRPAITKSSFSMKRLRQGSRKATVYVVVPFEHMSANARYMRVIVGAALLACREDGGEKKTLILLDEFPQLGTFEPIKEGLVTLRSQGVKIWMMLQDIGQLKERYKNWQDFMSSCDKQFFAVNDSETAEAIVKSLGDYVDREQTVERTKPLRSLSEVQEDLRKGSGMQYILPADGNPLKLALVPAYKNFADIKKKP